MEHIIEIKDFTKRYRTGVEAVKGIDLVVPRGQFFGLLGPNGAGKSTTIHCLTGIAMPSSGILKIAGLDVVANYREARTKIGLSPQEFNVDIFSTVRQIIDFMGGYYGLSKETRTRRVDELLTQFDLQAHKDKQFQHLSGGMKRRVMLARAMVHEPEVLILDEPTAGVDVEQRHELWKHLKALSAKGVTIVLTSHYLEEVEYLCDRIAIINGGKIVADAMKEEFIKDGDTLENAYLRITGNMHA
ncbi:hypothetical protein A3C89_04260 [Candidatus Kaiserbacteria bacterium RIFCSPHIGHO2_02_FULL_50_50]|uniref:ABC transporter domain-containing protein n=1 Tax=Candidatus Kaiserbacteria bacterium RIFCSPHIGHO2_02_FULL_50_50 TaxID=1798492 RepID=A0A1F6DDK9_9BACT|nr:MAG: hypothetical protein A3C89_04260 [Candidatus Kaiserbacteria bacterium RIFCSPHIGHO2_02_FULL_50_50]OGG89056.1 MAG: hypothetical protein A3G62_03960 [Candidatus Kaiserbacteria bacterium RIFCSPLOWO2_12_FULL_50_10]